jgi:tRNA(Ile)-lysidine synthase
MNFFRGTGLHGLTGIPAKSGYIRRPLLGFTKEQLLAFARENELEFVEDSSNLSSKYTRNYFRNEIIPAISKVYPQVNENLADNIQRFREIESLYKKAITDFKKKLCRQKGKEIHIPVKQLTAFNNKALIYEIITEYGFTEKQVDEVVKLCDSGSGKYISSGQHRIIRHRHWLIIGPVESENILIEEGIANIELGIGALELKTITNSHFPIPDSPGIAILDRKRITFPLLLRKWKQGDYFYPLGMKNSTGKVGKKKLSRFFIDQKLSKTEKENVWVIEMDKKILWVVGHRIDERFKINDSTEEVLQLTFKRKELL